MEEEVVRGTRWTFLGFAINRGLGFVTTLVLAHILAPQDFGIVAFAMVLIGLGQHLFTTGFGAAIVIRHDLQPSELGTAFSMLLVAHAALGLIVAGLSPLAGLMVDHPDSTRVMLGLAVPLFFGGVSSFYDALLQRDLRFRVQFTARTAQVISFSATAVALALLGHGVWSLVIAQAVSELFFASTLIRRSTLRIRPSFRSDVASSLWRTARGFTVHGTVSFAEQNMDYFVVGAALGTRPLGIYGLGYRISEIPCSAVVDPIAETTFPGFSKVHARGESPVAAFLAVLRLTSFCAFPVGILLAATARPAVATLLGSQWRPLVDVLPILGVWGSVRTIQSTIGWFLHSLGYAERIGLAYGLLLLCSTPILVLCASTVGLAGVAAVMLANVVVMLGIGVRIAAAHVGIPWRTQWASVRGAVLGSIPMAAVSAGVVAALTGLPSGFSLTVAVGAGCGAYLLAVSRLDPGILKDAFTQFSRVAGRATLGQPLAGDTFADSPMPGAKPAAPSIDEDPTQRGTSA